MKGRTVFVACSLALLLTIAAFASGAVEDARKGAYRLVGLFSQVLTLVRSNYVEEVPLDRLETGALAGLVEAADPGGAWVPGESAASFSELQRERELPPYGLVLGLRASYPFVLQVIPGSPADRAGLQPGELLEQVDGNMLRARPLWAAQLMLAEAETAGTKVALEVIDRSYDGKRRVVLTPGATEMPIPASVETRDGIPVLRLSAVTDKTPARVNAALGNLAASQAIVVDLRGLALGSEDAAAAVAAALAGGTVEIPTADREGPAATLSASAPARPWRIVAVLDPTTAGPGEIVALGLKARGATLVGGESYGDTATRHAVPAAGGELWIAQRWAIGPDGERLLGSGVKPDELVRPRKDADPLLERALEIARGSALRKAA